MGETDFGAINGTVAGGFEDSEERGEGRVENDMVGEGLGRVREEGDCWKKVTLLVRAPF